VPNLKFLSSTVAEIWRGSKNSIGHVTPLRPNFAFLIVPPVANLFVKFDANIFIGDGHLAIYYFADLAAKCLFPPILGGFWEFHH